MRSIQWLAALPLAAAAACSESTGPAASVPVTLSFSANSATGASFSRSADVTAASSPSADALVITKAQLVLARVELERAGATCTSEAASGDDDAAEHKDCAELELAPSVIDLPVNGTVVSALSVAIPEGSYSALEARLRPIVSGRGGPASTAFLAAHPDLNGVSVLVQGTFNGVAFTYKGAPSAGIERSFSPPLTVASGTPLNVTVNADLATWFRNSSGALIDPSTANAGGANAQLVADNIKRSFRAFRDDDHDGKDDDGR